MDYPVGLHTGVPARVYHQRSIGLVSKSALDLVDRSPAHYHAWVEGEGVDRDTPALVFGRAFHAALLEPEIFTSDFAVEPDFGNCRKADNRRARDDWRVQHAGTTILNEGDHGAILGMVESVRRHPLAAGMIRDGLAEVTAVWKDSETGLKCKCRADYYVKRLRMVADVKSTADASYDSFRRDIVKYRYHVQDALYRDAFDAVGEHVDHFVFIAVEKTAPYAVAVYSLDADAIGRGYTAARDNIDTMAECLRLNEWRGYPTSIQTMDLPPWA